MSSSLFSPNPPRPEVDRSTPEGRAALAVAATDARLRSMASALRMAYQLLRRDLAGNDQAYAAFEGLTSTGLTAQRLQELARLVKTTLNHAEPGAIVDDVPEVEVTFNA